jgi:PAS domain S-box-containing protein
LRICNGADSKRELMRGLTTFFQRLTGCEAVGVRLKEGDDFPYYETRGFSEEFVLAENRLCAFDQAGEMVRDSVGHPVYACMCGNIISGRFDSAKPFFTSHGSFWTGSTTELLAGTTGGERQAKTRNRCNGEGYESVALVPLCSRGETFGLFQFNDRRRGCFSTEKIALLESLVAYVAIALAKLKVDEALQEATQRLQLATASGQLGIWDWDVINDLVVWNDRMFEFYGVSRDNYRMNHEAWEKSLHPDDREKAIEAINAALSGDRKFDFEYRVVRPDGTEKFIKTNAMVIRDTDRKAVRMIGMAQDITDRKHMEEQLRQSQKMEAIGQLAGGVAHDFNNILTAIYGHCSVLQMKMGKDAPFRSDIDQIYAAAERAANLTRSLLAFSRKQIMSPKKVNLNEIVLNVGKLLTRIIGEDIQLKTVSTGKPHRVFADSGQIEQVLMNLAANARDAMPNGGIITIATELQEIDESFIQAYGYGEEGKYVVLSVSDTGRGMDAETSKKIFEPFFTTKEVGKGTGLGLSIVYGVIKQHNGYINVYSEPGKGTTFRIYLPQVYEEDADNEEEAPAVYPSMGSETVLVAEDDATIRELAESILKKFGYNVILALDGADAVEKFKAHSDEIAIIVMDMIMPRKSGKEAYEEICKVRADVKILFMSGYSPDLLHDRGIFDSSEEVLVKPIHPLDLVRKVRAMLDNHSQKGNGDSR